ncbi:MAG: Mur ligase family protein, partial [Candidatus Staskawiczbacteria bacterium]|nr:Mur ligase family protein [Candidatus Staskawiczbacteria bacterium]
MKNTLIVGYGKEGEISKKYIEGNYPDFKIGIADKKFGGNYLKKQEDFDIAIKTPGIKKELINIPYTTATNIFFSKIKELGNTIIGVTGSKGKSTTSSLIYSILQENGKNVKLLGNIGSPMLEIMAEPIRKDTIFILELSSYQLCDIEYSPDIAVVTNLFPEHMDFHAGLKNYYDAKKNIIRFQNKSDIFVYNQNNSKVMDWARFAKGKVIPFADKNFLNRLDLPLMGEHNKDNIAAAIAVTR